LLLLLLLLDLNSHTRLIIMVGQLMTTMACCLYYWTNRQSGSFLLHIYFCFVFLFLFIGHYVMYVWVSFFLSLSPPLLLSYFDYNKMVSCWYDTTMERCFEENLRNDPITRNINDDEYVLDSYLSALNSLFLYLCI
jgi:hypothetical protein